MKNSYNAIDANAGFDVESLHDGEVVAVIEKFRERNNKGDDIIELDATIDWVSNQDDQDHIGKVFQVGFLFTKNAAQFTVRRLKDLAKASGCDVANWTPENDLPLSKMIPGFLKLLAWKSIPVVGKISRSTKNESTKAFWNPTKVVRVNPVDGTRYADALPDQISNELIIEAFNAVLEGESAASFI